LVTEGDDFVDRRLSGLDFLGVSDLSEDSEDGGHTFGLEVGFFGLVEVLGNLG